MKFVVLLAGKGKRFGSLTKDNHKSLIKINDSFNHYIKQCVEHFKFTELSANIQNDYKHIDIPDSIKFMNCFSI